MGAVPDDDRLALVRDPHTGDACEIHVREDVAGAAGDGREDLQGFVLDQSRLRMVLTVWHLSLGDATAGQIHERGSARGRALVERENEIGGHGSS